MCREVVEENEQQDQPNGVGCRKRLANVIGTLGLILAVVALGAGFVVPEVRQWVGLDPPSTPTPTITPTPTPTPTPRILITEVYNAGRAEHVVIHNASAVDVDLSDWRLGESDHNVDPFVFPPGFILRSGLEVRVYSGPVWNRENPPSGLSWTTNIWNNDGETARLYDAQGNLVDEHTH